MLTDWLPTRCVVAGGGPAGLMLGYLLARADVEVVVLEKHADFLRDFRGDTVHPSTLELMYELGLLDEFLARPHQEYRSLTVQIGDRAIEAVDFRHVPTHCKFLALMPQWDFLDFIASKARRYPNFSLLMETEVKAPIIDHGVITGVRAKGPHGTIEIRAPLTVAADGRSSLLRRRAGMFPMDVGAPMDVLWFRLARHADDPEPVFRTAKGKIFVMFSRGDYWQCAYVIRKGGIGELEARGIEAFRHDIADIAPFLAQRAAELRSFDDVKLLTVAVNRLHRWYRPGFLCIGDAAHAMSPIGGVGVNLAIQDAVAAANILAPELEAGVPSVAALRRVQRRRQFPTWLTQTIQVALQNTIVGPVLRGTTAVGQGVPWPLALLERFAWLRRIPAYVIGVGIRPEHVRPQARARRAA